MDTLRVAEAEATLVSEDNFVELLEDAAADKGNALEISRIAGIMAAKNTPSAIPLCHTIPILHADCEFAVGEHELKLVFSCTTRAQTGVEIEALHAVSTAAVALYDVLKPHTDSLAIRDVHLRAKSGGKSDHRQSPDTPPRVVLHVLSDEGGVREIVDALRSNGVEPELREAVPDELPDIIETQPDSAKIEIVVADLQGVSDWHARLQRAIEVAMPGLAQAVRQHGLQRHPWAMFTTLITGWLGGTLVLTAPSDVRGAKEFSTALIPYILTATRDDLD
jgi:molybdenum cofactor biosynthesis protein MoaC